MIQLGMIGWRGMVGSVLLKRMSEENDWKLVETTFYSTSQAGDTAPKVANARPKLENAFDLKSLRQMNVIISCQGGDYTKEIFPKLRGEGWSGIWIDAASALRMDKDAIIILDPINRSLILDALKAGKKDFIGGNCTVSLLMLGLHGLLKQDVVEWISTMTYQAASGAGAKNMKELIAQMGFLAREAGELINDKSDVLLLDEKITGLLNDGRMPKENFGHALAANLLPYIDSELPSGQSREEWKSMAEANKILGRKVAIPIDGTCVRTGTMRCHAQAVTIKLKKSIPLPEIEGMIKSANEWVKLVPNNKPDSLKQLAPAAVSGTLGIAIGRVRPMTMGPDFINAFTIGDQLLWGAAEPLRRMLRIVLEK